MDWDYRIMSEYSKSNQADAGSVEELPKKKDEILQSITSMRALIKVGCVAFCVGVITGSWLVGIGVTLALPSC